LKHGALLKIPSPGFRQRNEQPVVYANHAEFGAIGGLGQAVGKGNAVAEVMVTIGAPRLQIVITEKRVAGLASDPFEGQELIFDRFHPLSQLSAADTTKRHPLHPPKAFLK
jgi:hypothetical protein